MNIYVYITKLPDRIHGYSAPCPEPDAFTVYLSDRLSREQMLETYQHELEHIKGNDFAEGNVAEMEEKAHKKPRPS